METCGRSYEHNRRNGDKNFGYAVHDLADVGRNNKFYFDNKEIVIPKGSYELRNI
ncbi:hypothetical protein ALC53_12503 [Atta colombica]|uniref:Uncharacterized protein n=1 Tax=Atta colombica TaxID=520822 RepID=A0A151HYZ8_9HYME|nr:hypothetical protein ALC53_12503 [Atta colombica]